MKGYMKNLEQFAFLTFNFFGVYPQMLFSTFSFI